jgi:zinc transporter 9
MSGFGSLLAMSGLLGLGSFFVAQLPLSFAFSNSTTVSLSNLGTGLLIGAALGVVLPEYVPNNVKWPEHIAYNCFD